ncbi:unnamed protein product [Miscanthus lutarioriparius]|uniref:Uncharacterized protein n=1 Tax=Miscanthus lutarioriparius TaxID=422564 RepID=A0A811R2M0_9POAL|nr:unnamed protein product [Miscanthus lutarioriparius]
MAISYLIYFTNLTLLGRGQQSQPITSSSSTVPKPRRQRASPSRLVKLYNDLTQPPKKRIWAIGFGGLLKIASKTLPIGFADWLMAECYDADSSELVFPSRGRILVNVDSVCRAFGLPNNGDEVKYELDVGAINFINDEYAGLAISPRCYPAIMDLSCVKKLNWCQFVVDQLKDVAAKMGKRRSFKGCLLVLVCLVIKLDTNRDGSFGKLKLKGSSYSTPQPSLFHMDDIRRFVSSKVPSGISDQTRCTSYMLRLKC